MQSFLSSVFSEMSSRMKTPLLGTFVLSWLAYNHDHVAKLLFSDNTQRIALIESTPFNLNSDLLLPLALALAYLFIVPLAQWVIDIVKYWLVDKRRTATHHQHLHEKYLGQARVVQQQSKASLEYWQELYRNRAEDAGKRIIELKDLISHLKIQNQELEKQKTAAEGSASNLQRENSQIASEYENVSKELDELKKYIEVRDKDFRELIKNSKDLVSVLKGKNQELPKLLQHNPEVRGVIRDRMSELMHRYDQYHEFKSDILKTMNEIMRELDNISETGKSRINDLTSKLDEYIQSITKIIAQNAYEQRIFSINT